MLGMKTKQYTKRFLIHRALLSDYKMTETSIRKSILQYTPQVEN